MHTQANLPSVLFILQVCTIGDLQPSTGLDTLHLRFRYQPSGSDTAGVIQDYITAEVLAKTPSIGQYKLNCV